MTVKGIFHFIACFTVLFFVLLSFKATSQYRVDFNYGYKGFEPNNLPGWATVAGDGDVVFRQKYEEGSAVLIVDSRKDKRNIWYAFMHQDISAHIDVEKLKNPDYELRMEIRVRTSHAPRRINMYLSELNKGGYLREFDIADAHQWTTLSMVTENFTPAKGIPLMAQVSFMDWGVSDIYSLEIDYIKVDLVSLNDELPQYGLPLVYRPPLKNPEDFTHSLNANRAITIDSSYPDTNFSELISETDSAKVLAVNNTSVVLLSWDFSSVNNLDVQGPGQLEIYTHSLTRLLNSPKDFGEIRVVEILDGNMTLPVEEFTFNRFLAGKPTGQCFNSQNTIDSKVQAQKGDATYLTISQPVMERLISGRTKGLAILPLGYLSATFYADEEPELAPRLRFNILD